VRRHEPDQRALSARLRDLAQRRLEIPLLVALLRLPRGGDVLELGCGTGNALACLDAALEPRALVGVDRETDKGVVGDVTALPFLDGSFDLVLDFGTCQLAGPAALAEVCRVLRPDGLFVHETRWAQQLAHPRAGWARGLGPVNGLVPVAAAGLWAMRRRVALTVEPPQQHEGRHLARRAGPVRRG
jgi:SAM-dependent methyltransferase